MLSSEASTTIQPSASTSEDGARFGPCDHLIRSSLKTVVSAFSCGSSLTVIEERQSRRGLVSKVSVLSVERNHWQLTPTVRSI